jgi:hypothetical protein
MWRLGKGLLRRLSAGHRHFDAPAFVTLRGGRHSHLPPLRPVPTKLIPGETIGPRIAARKLPNGRASSIPCRRDLWGAHQ